MGARVAEITRISSMVDIVLADQIERAEEAGVQVAARAWGILASVDGKLRRVSLRVASASGPLAARAETMDGFVYSSVASVLFEEPGCTAYASARSKKLGVHMGGDSGNPEDGHSGLLVCHHIGHMALFRLATLRNVPLPPNATFKSLRGPVMICATLPHVVGGVQYDIVVDLPEMALGLVETL